MDLGLKSQIKHIFPPKFMFSYLCFCFSETLNKMPDEIRLEKKNVYSKTWIIIRLFLLNDLEAIGKVNNLHLLDCPKDVKSVQVADLL